MIIRQSVISIESSRTSLPSSARHVSETSMRLASSQGGSFGNIPSMRRSSTTKRPRARCTPSRPMVILRSSQSPPAFSARALSTGPRSMVTVETTTTAMMMAMVTANRRA